MQFLHRLFGKEQNSEELSPSQIDTAPLRPLPAGPDQNANNSKTDIFGQPIQLDLPQFIVGCGHSAGLQRDHNEDALFTLTTNLVSEDRVIPFGLYIIADGMGGHQHGEVASSIAIREVAKYVIQKIYLSYMGLEDGQSEESVQEILKTSISQAHRMILKVAQGGGTTLTAALIMGDKLTIAHVGDSRAYTISLDGHPEALTQDHSLVKRLVELGQITVEEAAVHPQRNVIIRALGQGEPFEPDIATYPLPRLCHLLLCSDGLWGVVPEELLVRIINSATSPQTACQYLANAANEAGGPDNITMILIRLPD